jgi:hypothetical protein
LPPAKKSDAETLPDPELNPLLNPILGAHMGRWAEVYFTSPPEKRGEAVAELLRELQNSEPSQDAAARTGDDLYRSAGGDPRRNQIEEERPAERGTIANTSFVDPFTCTGCGYHNTLGQMFCGMCGAPLKSTFQMLGEAESPAGTAHPPRSQGRWSEPEFPVGENDGLENAGMGEFTSPAAVFPAVTSPIRIFPVEEERNQQYQFWRPPEPELPSFAVETEAVPYRYRIYVGAGLAILLGVLLYMAWRGTTTFSGGPRSAASRAIPSAPPAAPPTSPAAEQPQGNARPAGQSTKPSQPEESISRSESGLREEQKAAATPSAASGGFANSSNRLQARDAHSGPHVVPVAATPLTMAGQSGAEELGLAEKYLGARDGRQAAGWLWKSVAKGNVAATIALSDLYLRGDGVTQSCDQGRLLLDAAAKKGGKGAAERLRNLQAFGCR